MYSKDTFVQVLERLVFFNRSKSENETGKTDQRGQASGESALSARVVVVSAVVLLISCITCMPNTQNQAWAQVSRTADGERD